MTFDMNQRLPQSGMKVGEAIERAAKWWNNWRGAVRRDFNKRQDAPLVRAASGRAPALIIKGEIVDDVPSGILSGKPWHELAQREQFEVVKMWHDQHVLKPMREEAVREAGRIIGGKA